ncbi:apurinic/apyrimidinic endonuclease, putative [Theileria equi strain WA]|uniref:Apurinic/apyrimidinic endonuclease, putative n=1 Tax=Theileria equi strain WA TaxID=1537102 RepID=L0AVZ0_THEEQ|nr:apurinic/apyrimidinic endonuclease, putative [Theileria equi strain WA]AFZ79201.1 apurinic/apyrimidinic endonuclease, putative [Theileria equi strain WA]|eukprot:XP_004828867.1 apurinic/apyrimidinic endonuclease, putative [Theileria equi strain WA]
MAVKSENGKSTSTKKTGIDKKGTKKATQTKLTFEATSPVKSSWATMPTLDPKEDPQEAFNKIAKMRELSNVYIGAHISASGGPEQSITNAFNICGQSFALFLKNQRRWSCAPLTPGSIDKFKEGLKARGYEPKYILPHGSYLINMANPDPEKRERAFENFMDDLKRCEQLGILLYNFHPGSTVGMCSKAEGIKNIAECINKAIELTNEVKIVLENAAGQKNVIGSKFEDLRDIIALVHNKSRVGVCLDTCHLFAAGYDIRTESNFKSIMEQFDEIVGLKYLSAVHLNDSKSDLGSGLDRHENIGKGKLSEETFKFIVNSGYFKNMPIILETPIENDESVYKREVLFMYSLLSLKKEP